MVPTLHRVRHTYNVWRPVLRWVPPITRCRSLTCIGGGSRTKNQEVTVLDWPGTFAVAEPDSGSLGAEYREGLGRAHTGTASQAARSASRGQAAQAVRLPRRSIRRSDQGERPL